MKKLVSILMALIMVFAMGTVAFAGEPVMNETELQEAINAGGTVVLGDSFEINGTITVPEDVTVTLDLNGKTISGTDNSTSSFGLIVVKKNANLTVTDNVGGGAIELTAKNDNGFNRYSSVISNQQGTVTIMEGTIEHKGGHSMSYAIDNITNGNNGDAKLYVKGGTIKSTYFAIRQFLNSSTKENILEVSGDVVVGGNNGIYFQVANEDSDKKGTLNIKGGTIEGTNRALYISGNYSDNVSVNISEGEIKGEVYLWSYNETDEPVLKITGGKIDGKFADATYDWQKDNILISGGTFSELPTEEYLADGAVVTVDGEEYEKNGDELIKHEDADKDHNCDCVLDDCDRKFGEHADADNDHACDYGCKEAIGEHEDKNEDHKCDYDGCGKTLSDCVMGEWVVIRKPGCEINGIERRYCEYNGCSGYQERPIRASHDYENGVCERCGKVSGIDYIDGAIGSEEEPEEANPNTGAPVMIPAAAVLAALSGIVVFKKR